MTSGYRVTSVQTSAARKVSATVATTDHRTTEAGTRTPSVSSAGRTSFGRRMPCTYSPANRETPTYSATHRGGASKKAHLARRNSSGRQRHHVKALPSVAQRTATSPIQNHKSRSTP